MKKVKYFKYLKNTNLFARVKLNLKFINIFTNYIIKYINKFAIPIWYCLYEIVRVVLESKSRFYSYNIHHKIKKMYLN